MNIAVVLASLNRPTLPKIIERMSGVNELLVWTGGSHDVVYKTNKLVSISDSDTFIVINDRTLLVPGWKDKLYEKSEKYPHCEVFSFTVTTCSQFAVKKAFLQRNYSGALFYPGYKHYHADQEIGELARKQNVYVEIPDMIESIAEKQDKNIKDCSNDTKLYEFRQQLQFPPV